MHIGIVTDTYLPRVNGVVQSIRTFTQQFRKRGHKVTIMAPAFPEIKEPEQDIWRFPSRYLFFNPEDRLPKPNDPVSRKMLLQIPDLKLDIIHTQTPFALGIAVAKLARKLKIPSVHTYHTLFEAYMPLYFPYIPAFMGKWFARSFSRKFCNWHTQVVVPSTAIAQVLKEYGVKSPIAIIPTGTDLTPFQKVDGERMRKKMGFGPDQPLLLTMGRVAHEKNIPFLFDVLERLKNKQAKLVIAGQGPALEDVKAISRQRKLGDRVMFVGLLSKEDWADLYAAADLHLLASVTETQGLVLTEAMAAGTPCVAVAAMGVKDVMAGGGGLAVPLDVAQFTDAVDRMLSDKKFYKEKKDECKTQAKLWSAEAKAEQMLANYQQLIDHFKK